MAFIAFYKIDEFLSHLVANCLTLLPIWFTLSSFSCGLLKFGVPCSYLVSTTGVSGVRYLTLHPLNFSTTFLSSNYKGSTTVHKVVLDNGDNT